MYKLVVSSITKEHSQADNSDYLRMEVSIVDSQTEGIVSQSYHAFPFNTPAEEVQAQLQKILTTFISDQKLAQDNAQQEASQVAADNIINSFAGKEFVLEDQINTQDSVDTTVTNGPLLDQAPQFEGNVANSTNSGEDYGTDEDGEDTNV